jgi:hypothetical protein
METRFDADSLRRLRVVLVVECPRLAHDRVPGDSHGDIRHATLSRDCSDTFKIFGSTKLTDFVNRSPFGKPVTRRNRQHRGATFSRCRRVFDKHAQNVILLDEHFGQSDHSKVACQQQKASALRARDAQLLEGSS